jgi:hypothetical protein
MSDETPKVTELHAVKAQDLQAIASALKPALHAKFQELCIILDKMAAAGISVDFVFTKPAANLPWQVTSKVYKEL